MRRRSWHLPRHARQVAHVWAQGGLLDDLCRVGRHDASRCRPEKLNNLHLPVYLNVRDMLQAQTSRICLLWCIAWLICDKRLNGSDCVNLAKRCVCSVPRLLTSLVHRVASGHTVCAICHICRKHSRDGSEVPAARTREPCTPQATAAAWAYCWCRAGLVCVG